MIDVVLRLVLVLVLITLEREEEDEDVNNLSSLESLPLEIRLIAELLNELIRLVEFSAFTRKLLLLLRCKEVEELELSAVF
jgi:hypothetical protein